MAAIAGAPPALDRPPRLDAPAYCARLKDVAGGSTALENACLTREQEAYDALRERWAALPPGARDYCLRLARTAGGSYAFLAACLDRETEAAATKPRFRY